MATINSVTLSGLLARDPEVREYAPGKSLARVVVCTTDTFKKRDGTEAKEVLFTTITLWGQEALNAAKYLAKGKAVTILGKLKEEKWTDKNSGLERRKLSVVADCIMYLEKMEPVANYVDPAPQKTQQVQQQLQAEPIHDNNENYDELPF